MLILLRRVGQAIGVGDEFLITVSRIVGNSVEVVIVNQWNERKSIHQLEIGNSIEFAPSMKLTLTKIVEVDGLIAGFENAARLGFDTPRETPLFRKEDSIRD